MPLICIFISIGVTLIEHHADCFFICLEVVVGSYYYSAAYSACSDNVIAGNGYNHNLWRFIFFLFHFCTPSIIWNNHKPTSRNYTLPS